MFDIKVSEIKQQRGVLFGTHDLDGEVDFDAGVFFGHLIAAFSFGVEVIVKEHAVLCDLKQLPVPLVCFTNIVRRAGCLDRDLLLICEFNSIDRELEILLGTVNIFYGIFINNVDRIKCKSIIVIILYHRSTHFLRIDGYFIIRSGDFQISVYLIVFNGLPVDRYVRHCVTKTHDSVIGFRQLVPIGVFLVRSFINAWGEETGTVNVGVSLGAVPVNICVIMLAGAADVGRYVRIGSPIVTLPSGHSLYHAVIGR